MGWATYHITRLKAGETIQIRPQGTSMRGKIESGQLCTVTPVDATTVQEGDIVMCKVNGKEYLHLVTAVEGGRFQISNNRGLVNGWIGPAAIFGKCVRVED
jgi:SOS-response transcriptional repressor LexA